jgi:hypothetical protein
VFEVTCRDIKCWTVEVASTIVFVALVIWVLAGEFNVSIKLHKDVMVPVKVAIQKEASTQTVPAEEASVEA